MNKLMVLFVMTTYVLNCVAQKNALYEFKFYFEDAAGYKDTILYRCLLYTSPSPRDRTRSRMPSSA